MNTLTLPADLRAAVAQALAAVPATRWLREAQLLSERYRSTRTENAQPLAHGPDQALGYAALILPATYAQLHGAMAAAGARIPEWQPATLLDLGSGPGTALWAAAAQWPSLRTLVAYEREPALIALGKQLAQQSATPAVRGAQWQRADLRQLGNEARRYDLVVLGHVLNELDAATQAAAVEWAWQRTAGLLLIVEPGTSAAFPYVRSARDWLLGVGGHTVAPCAHDQPCPLQNDWCHFPQRLMRPDFQKRARGAPSDWEDSKFSYAAMARFAPTSTIWGRVIDEPFSNKAYAALTVSATQGVQQIRALKRHRDAFRWLRNLEWGQALSEPLPELVVTSGK